MKLPYGSAAIIGMLPTSVSTSCETEHGGRLRLDQRPVGHAAVGRAEELAGRDRPTRGVVDVLAQEHLVRRVRGVGLALVDERRVGVGRAAHARRRRSTVVPRVSTMKRRPAGSSSPVPTMPSGPA